MSIDLSVISLVSVATGCYAEISKLNIINIFNNTFENNYALNEIDINDTNTVGGVFMFSCLNVNITNSNFDSCHSTFDGALDI